MVQKGKCVLDSGQCLGNPIVPQVWGHAQFLSLAASSAIALLQLASLKDANKGSRSRVHNPWSSSVAVGCSRSPEGCVGLDRVR